MKYKIEFRVNFSKAQGLANSPKLNKWTLPEVTMLRKITKVINFVLGESDLESFDQLTELTIDR